MSKATLRIGHIRSSSGPDYVMVEVEFPREADGSRRRLRMEMSFAALGRALVNLPGECEFEEKAFKPSKGA